MGRPLDLVRGPSNVASKVLDRERLRGIAAAQRAGPVLGNEDSDDVLLDSFKIEEFDEGDYGSGEDFGGGEF